MRESDDLACSTRGYESVGSARVQAAYVSPMASYAIDIYAGVRQLVAGAVHESGDLTCCTTGYASLGTDAVDLTTNWPPGRVLETTPCRHRFLSCSLPKNSYEPALRGYWPRT